MNPMPPFPIEMLCVSGKDFPNRVVRAKTPFMRGNAFFFGGCDRRPFYAVVLRYSGAPGGRSLRAPAGPAPHPLPCGHQGTVARRLVPSNHG